jgi:hypothetical protein
MNDAPQISANAARMTGFRRTPVETRGWAVLFDGSVVVRAV